MRESGVQGRGAQERSRCRGGDFPGGPARPEATRQGAMDHDSKQGLAANVFDKLSRPISVS